MLSYQVPVPGNTFIAAPYSSHLPKRDVVVGSGIPSDLDIYTWYLVYILLCLVVLQLCNVLISFFGCMSNGTPAAYQVPAMPVALCRWNLLVQRSTCLSVVQALGVEMTKTFAKEAVRVGYVQRSHRGSTSRFVRS